MAGALEDGASLDAAGGAADGDPDGSVEPGASEGGAAEGAGDPAVPAGRPEAAAGEEDETDAAAGGLRVGPVRAACANAVEVAAKSTHPVMIDGQRMAPLPTSRRLLRARRRAPRE